MTKRPEGDLSLGGDRDPKFAELSWPQQIAIFNYEPNLRLISAEADLLRSNKLYASLPQSFLVEVRADKALIPKVSAERIKKEAEMKVVITRLIHEPAYRREKLGL